jgi:GxxExxY protein
MIEATEGMEGIGHPLQCFPCFPWPNTALTKETTTASVQGGTMSGKLLEEKLSYRIRGCVYEVYRELGAGFLEKVYESALLIELRAAGLNAGAQTPIRVRYKGREIGHFAADIVVEDKILLELKAVSILRPEHEAQILHYLKATGLKLGLLMSFTAPRAEIKRIIA